MCGYVYRLRGRYVHRLESVRKLAVSRQICTCLVCYIPCRKLLPVRDIGRAREVSESFSEARAYKFWASCQYILYPDPRITFGLLVTTFF